MRWFYYSSVIVLALGLLLFSSTPMLSPLYQYVLAFGLGWLGLNLIFIVILSIRSKSSAVIDSRKKNKGKEKSVEKKIPEKSRIKSTASFIFMTLMGLNQDKAKPQSFKVTKSIIKGAKSIYAKRRDKFLTNLKISLWCSSALIITFFLSITGFRAADTVDRQVIQLGEATPIFGGAPWFGFTSIYSEFSYFLLLFIINLFLMLGLLKIARVHYKYKALKPSHSLKSLIINAIIVLVMLMMTIYVFA